MYVVAKEGRLLGVLCLARTAIICAVLLVGCRDNTNELDVGRYQEATTPAAKLRFFDKNVTFAALNSGSSFKDLEAAFNAHVGAEYGIEVVVERMPAPSAEPAWETYKQSKDVDLVRRAAMDVTDELAKYRPERIRALPIGTIHFVKDMSAHGIPALGSSRDGDIYIRALPDDKSRRSVFQHELMHCIENGLHVTSDAALNEKLAKWDSTNPPGFTWTGEASANSSPPARGFIGSYATSSAVEDRAATWAKLMTDFDGTSNRFRSDPYLHAKSELLISIVQLMDPAVNASYLANVNGSAAQ